MNKKKCAILYGGLMQGEIFNKCFKKHKENLINNNDNYDFDIFIHSWEDDGNLKNWCPWYGKGDKINYFIDKNYIFTNVKPKKYLFETQIDVSEQKYETYLGPGFQTYGGKNTHKTYNNLMYSKTLNKAYNFTMVSAHLSYYKCKNLMVEFESENNIKYDLIITFRPDYYLLKKINLDDYNLNLINNFHYNYYNQIIPEKNILNKKPKNNKKEYRSSFFLNLFNIFNRKNGLICIDFFKYIKDYNVCNKELKKSVRYKLDLNLVEIHNYNLCKYIFDKKINVRQYYDKIYGATYRNNSGLCLYDYHIPPNLFCKFLKKKLSVDEILQEEKKLDTKQKLNLPNFWDYKSHYYYIPLGDPITINGKKK